MLVRKQVFNFKLLDSVEAAKMDCCQHFFTLIDDYLCKCGDTRTISDRDKILEHSQIISFDTNSIKLEFSVNSDEILEYDLVRVGEYNKESENTLTKNNDAEYCTFENPIENVLEYSSPEGKTDGLLKENTWSYKIFIKIIQLGENCYYFYTI